jgi:hypothetical protein
VKGTSSHAQNVAYLSHHSEGHINYGTLCLLRKNGVSGLPNISRNLKQCDACILGKHSKRPFPRLFPLLLVFFTKCKSMQ